MTTATATAPVLDGAWCIVELMGRRRLVARVTEQTIAGAGFLRLDEPAVGDEPARTQWASPASVYAIHPCTEDAAMAVAENWRSGPISPYDLPDEWRKAIAASREPEPWESSHDDGFADGDELS